MQLGYQNPWGFLRKGRLFEDLDALAGDTAGKTGERTAFSSALVVLTLPPSTCLQGTSPSTTASGITG